MTRETKIGLLVGLAFIIVIGVLLSDHLTTRGELTKAELTQVGENVRNAAAVPAGGAPPITPVAVPQNVTPAAPVLTSEELNLRPPTSIVQVGPAPVQSQPLLIPAPVDIPAGYGSTTAAGVQEPAVLTAPIRETYGQPLIAVAATTPANPADDMKPVEPNQPLQVAANPNLKPIKAEKGDTISRWASKYLGSNTTANRQAIIDANPVLKANPAKVILGNTYMIPDRATVASATVAPTVTTPAIPETVPATNNMVNMDARRVEELMSRPQQQTQSTTVTTVQTAEATKPAAKPAGTTTYTVKSNDTLWGIASKLGDAGLVKEIQSLNKDLLKGKAVLKPGMTLKVPSRTSVASR